MLTREDGVLIVAAPNREFWRIWLEDNHQSVEKVWLLIYHKESKIPSVYYPEAVEEALCFGWIDSKPNKRDEKSFYQFFSKRNPKSNWSAINKNKVKELIAQGKMSAAGLEMVRIAKETGTWNALNDVENLILPSDLEEVLNTLPNAKEYFEKFPKSVKRGILEWILNAKKVETRQKRIQETAMLASENKRANQFRNS